MILVLADLAGQGKDPDALFPGPRRSPAGADARPRQDRLQPVLHLPSPGVTTCGRCANTARSCRLADYMRPNFGPTRRTSAEALQYGGPPMSRSVRYWPDLLSPAWGMFNAATSSSSTWPGRRRRVLTTRSTSCAPGTGRRPKAAGESLAPSSPAQPDPAANPALHWLRNLRFHHIDTRPCCAGPSATGVGQHGVSGLLVRSGNVQWATPPGHAALASTGTSGSPYGTS